MDEQNRCFQCGQPGQELYGYIICDKCQARLGLFTDEKIRQHSADFKRTPDAPSYADEVRERLDLMEKDYIKKRIKLLHILDRLENDNEYLA